MEWLTSFLDDSKQKLSDILSIPKDTKAFGIGLANANSSIGGALGRGVQLLNQGNEGLLSEVNARPTPTTSKGFSTNFAGGPLPKVNIPDVHSNAKKQTTMGNNQDKANAVLSAVKLLTQKKPKAITPGSSPHLNVTKPKFPFYVPRIDEELLEL